MFGATVAIDAAGKAALVCAPNAAVGSVTGAGRCWAFSGNNFGTVTAISAANPSVDANFGGNDGSAKIATQADGAMVVAIGAPGLPVTNSVPVVAGSVQVTRISSTGSVVSSFTRSGSSGDQLGTMIVMSSDGNLVFAGASTAASGIGTVTVLRSTSNVWSVAQMLNVSSAGAIGFGFGLALSADSSRLVVGAGYSKTLPGQAFTFSSTPSGAYVLENQWAAPSPAAGDAFAYCVGIAGDSSSITATGLSSTVLVYLRIPPKFVPMAPIPISIAAGVLFGITGGFLVGAGVFFAAKAVVRLVAKPEVAPATTPEKAA
jgi:hypothetical protein